MIIISDVVNTSINYLKLIEKTYICVIKFAFISAITIYLGSKILFEHLTLKTFEQIKNKNNEDCCVTRPNKNETNIRREDILDNVQTVT